MSGRIIRSFTYNGSTSEGIMEVAGTEAEIRKKFASEQERCYEDNKDCMGYFAVRLELDK